MADESDLSESVRGERSGTHLERRFNAFNANSVRVLAPPFPRQIQVETTNICNHGCSFCEYTFMKRPKRHLDKDLFYRIVKDAFDLGAREIGLFAGAEPLTCKNLEDYTAYCHDLGYEYSYISTNGALADTARWRRILDAGMRSVKFSVNGGTREPYKVVHGRDDFEKVLANIGFLAEYRRTLPHKVFLAVSFVGCDQNAGTYEPLKAAIGGVVDEIMFYEVSARAGQHYDHPPIALRDCNLPFNKVTITREGYLRACCNDYENLLAIEDLTKVSLKDAWHSARFQDFRRRHMEDRLSGTFCANCIRGATEAPTPLNPALTAQARS